MHIAYTQHAASASSVGDSQRIGSVLMSAPFPRPERHLHFNLLTCTPRAMINVHTYLSLFME
jgi:hypothetical protein